MNKPEIFIEITPKGEVRAEIRGAKGKACLEYARLLEEIVGTTTTQELTAEYYEPEGQVSLFGQDSVHIDQAR